MYKNGTIGISHYFQQNLQNRRPKSSSLMLHRDRVAAAPAASLPPTVTKMPSSSELGEEDTVAATATTTSATITGIG